MTAESPLFSSVLLLEDDSGHALLVSRALRGLATEVIHVPSLTEGLKRLDAHRIDIIVSDLNLTDARDLPLVAALREKAPATPLIVLTSSTSLASAVGAMKLGARDFLVKEFGPDFRDVLTLALSRIAHSLALERERVRLQREMAILRLAIENTNDGLAVLLSNGETMYSNSAFKQAVESWGGDPARISTLMSPRVTHGEGVGRLLEEKFRSLGEFGVWSTEITVTDQKDVAFELSLSLLPTSTDPQEEEPRSGVIWLRDRSEEKRRERFQREILSTTTHDLKGPLGAIMLSADLIQSNLTSTDKVRELSLRIASSAQGSVNLIDEFLSARRIQEGTFILKPSPNDLSKVIAEAVENFTSMAAAKRISVQVEAPSEGLVGSFDRLAILRVLGNLVGNAIKFTPKEGSVVIGAAPRDHEIAFWVQDTGTGMEPAEVNKIFDRFSRLAKHSDVAGSGLGLFVVKSIVGAHGGRIDVTSASGKGTTFEVTIPLSPPVNDKGELISLDFA